MADVSIVVYPTHPFKPTRYYKVGGQQVNAHDREPLFGKRRASFELIEYLKRQEEPCDLVIVGALDDSVRIACNLVEHFPLLTASGGEGQMVPAAPAGERVA